MKAVVVKAFGPIENATLEDVAEPKPGPNEVVVVVEAAEANYPDLLMMEGRYQVKPTLPFVPGKGCAGRIVELGPGVKDLALGQRVAVQLEHGAFAEKVCVRCELCYPAPDGIDARTAAASVLTYQTAWFALTDRARLQPGETVLVLGSGGGVGIAAIQLAKMMGASLVIGATRGSAKHDLIKTAGADAIIDTSLADLREQVLAATGKRAVDIVIDPVGGPSFEPALKTLAWRGRLIVVGFVGGHIPQARANYLLVKNIAVIGLQASDYRDRWPKACAEAQAAIFAAIERGDFKPLVSAVYPISEFKSALAALRNGEIGGKAVLVPDGFGE